MPLLASLSVLAPLALATPAPVAPAHALPAQEKPTPGRARPWVLRLVDGRVLRVHARRATDAASAAWEVREGRGKAARWSAIPAERVVRATPESELLREASVLERKAGEDPLRRAAYAEWLVQQGLLAEGLRALDELLAADPEDGGALGVLERAVFRFRLPELNPGTTEAELAGFLDAAARSTPTGRERGARKLAALEDVDRLERTLRGELVHADARRRGFATLALRRNAPGRAAQPLLARALLDPSGEVRLGAGLALRACQDPAVIAPAVRALSSEHARLRLHATEALGTMGYPAAVEPLVAHFARLAAAGGGAPRAPHSHVFTGRQLAYVQDFDVEVASNAAIADPTINVLSEGAVLDAAVLSSRTLAAGGERRAVHGALRRLTGADPGSTASAWQEWWRKHGEAWRVGVPDSGEPSVTPSGRRP